MKALCPKCGGTGEIDRMYLGMKVVPDILEQTPKEVWQEYLAAGYTLTQAVAEELSYGDSFHGK